MYKIDPIVKKISSEIVVCTGDQKLNLIRDMLLIGSMQRMKE